MKKLRTLLVIFDTQVAASQTSAFRGAIIEKAGRENILFHNHLGKDSYLYKYPLIQYKSIRQQPAIFCVDAGVEEIHKLFEQKSWQINFQGELLDLKVDRLDLKNVTLNVWEKFFDYTIRSWQALNEKNYSSYQKLSSLSEKVAMLERILTGNILSFAKGVDWHIDKPVKIVIKDIERETVSRMKDTRVSAFNVSFKSNVFLPDFIGLGKGASTGFGMVKQIRNSNNGE